MYEMIEKLTEPDTEVADLTVQCEQCCYDEVPSPEMVIAIVNYVLVLDTPGTSSIILTSRKQPP
jgi:hypothetical protein